MPLYSMVGKDDDGEPYVAPNVDTTEAKARARERDLTGFILLPEGGGEHDHIAYRRNREHPEGYEGSRSGARVREWVFSNLLHRTAGGEEQQAPRSDHRSRAPAWW